MKKIVFFDIDNTLYSHKNHQVVPSAIEAIKTLKEKGILCFIATSRSKREITNIPSDVLALMDGIISAGGAKIEYQGKLIHIETMDQTDQTRLIELLRDYKLAYRYCGVEEQVNYLNSDDEYAVSRFSTLYEWVPSIVPYTPQPLTHVLFYCFDDQLASHIINSLPNTQSIILTHAYELTAKGVTKAYGMHKVCQLLNISVKDTVAFGDSGNDIELLRQSSLGIAMGNGSLSVQRCADYVTDDIDNDGILKACQHFNWFQ